MKFVAIRGVSRGVEAPPPLIHAKFLTFYSAAAAAIAVNNYSTLELPSPRQKKLILGFWEFSTHRISF